MCGTVAGGDVDWDGKAEAGCGGVAAQAAARGVTSGRLGRKTKNCASARTCTWLAMTLATMSAVEVQSLAEAPAAPIPWLSKDHMEVDCPKKP